MIGREDTSERDLFVLAVADVASLPERYPVPSPHFVALLAMDASSIEDAAIERLAEGLLFSGCVFFISWGRIASECTTCSIPSPIPTIR